MEPFKPVEPFEPVDPEDPDEPRSNELSRDDMVVVVVHVVEVGRC